MKNLIIPILGPMVPCFHLYHNFHMDWPPEFKPYMLIAVVYQSIIYLLVLFKYSHLLDELKKPFQILNIGMFLMLLTFCFYKLVKIYSNSGLTEVFFDELMNCFFTLAVSVLMYYMEKIVEIIALKIN